MRLLPAVLAAFALTACATEPHNATVVVPARAEGTRSPAPASEPVDCPPGDGGRTTGCEGPVSGQYPWTAEDYGHVAAVYDDMAAEAHSDYEREVYEDVADRSRERAREMRQENAESPRPTHP